MLGQKEQLGTNHNAKSMVNQYHEFRTAIQSQKQVSHQVHHFGNSRQRFNFEVDEVLDMDAQLGNVSPRERQ